MDSPIPTRRPIHRLMLISAALLVYADGALAADFVGDVQLQVRAVLTGTSSGRPNAVDQPIATSTDGRQRSDTDPQEQARQFILGVNNRAGQVGQSKSVDSKSDITPAVSARENRVYADTSEAVRRMIRGLAG